ncbi:MAG: DUF935 family protein [Sphingobacteriaceae bacterium]|nr:DUF935 family protein [Sphingobacteriaceae bacterium]
MKNIFNIFKNTPKTTQPNYIKVQAKDNADYKILTQILDTHIDFSRKEIKHWREAIQLAKAPETPNLVDLQDIYTDKGMDAHLQAQIMLRKMAVQNTPFFIYKDSGEIDPQASTIFNKKWAFDIIDELLNSVLFGTTIIEIQQVSKNNVSFAVIPRRNVVPKLKKVLTNAYDYQTAIDYSAPQYANTIIQLGDDDNIGIVNNILPQLIWKNHAQQSWAEFSERFGIPMVVAFTNQRDPKFISELNDKLRDLGESVSATMPIGTQLEIKQPTNTDAYQVFKARMDFCNEEISKQIVGGTMLSDSGSSRAQSEVHERNLDAKISLGDMRLIEFYFNDIIIPVLQRNGLAVPANTRFAFDKTMQLSPKETLEIVKGLSENYTISAEWVSKTFNIPLEAKAITSTEPSLDPNAKKKSFDTPQALAPCCGPITAAIKDTEVKNLKNRLNTIAKELYNQNSDTALANTALSATQTANILNKALAEGFDISPDIAYDSPDYVAYQAMQMNVFQFSAAKQLDMLQYANAMLLDEKGERRSFHSFQQKIDLLGNDYQKNKLRAEYNLATATGQSAANWHRLMADKQNVPYVQYQTMADSRVRNEHSTLNNRVFSLNDANLGKILPPNGWGCRCELVAYPYKPKEVADAGALIGSAKIKADFQINRAVAKEVFTANQMYIKTNIDEQLAKLNDITWQHYGLAETPVSDVALKIDDKLTIKDVRKAFTEAMDKNKNVVYEDYMKRKLVLGENNFIKHTEGKYILSDENRHLYFDKIGEVLAEPTEVYLRYYGVLPSMRYIKYYNDGSSIIVQGGFNEEGLFEIGSWFKNNTQENRKGWLVK